MKLNKNKGNLQSQLAKMLQAGMENVESEQKIDTQNINAEELHTNGQTRNSATTESESVKETPMAENDIKNPNAQKRTTHTVGETSQSATESDKQIIDSPDIQIEESTQQPTTKHTTKQGASSTSRTSPRASTRSSRQINPHENITPRLNAAQRHEVPDHNAKYAGEPIKSVGCRMPQSLYARMLQYKALNDSQINRITLNDIIIEAVEKFMDENQ